TRFLNGFVPNTGDVFPVLNYGARSGVFAQLTGVTFGDHQSLKTDYTATVLNLVGIIAGIDVSPTSGLTTTESGGTAQFQVVLASQPAADVTINVHSSDTIHGGTISTSSLTFTPGDWNVPQTVTITGVDDLAIGPDTPYTIVTDPAISADPIY